MITPPLSFSLAHKEPLMLEITMRAPEVIYDLLNVSLSGWKIAPKEFSTDPQIEVVHDGKFSVCSSSYSGTRPHSDFINALNEVLIAVAYSVRQAKPDYSLVHAAALEIDGRKVVYFGRSKSGKSRYAAMRCVAGARCLADDLLLYSSKAGYFETLGLPIRMRRPLPDDLLNAIDSKKILVGHSLCYLPNAAVSIAPAGQIFVADDLFAFDHNYQPQPWALSRQHELVSQYVIEG